ncbi:MAG: TonB-dependent receptor [Bacteroidales bacterium]|nr:TonB-dependent receptor [Bacteroidales bacterium]
MIKKLAISILVLFSLNTFLFSQTKPGTFSPRVGQLSGAVFDKDAGTALEYATVALFNVKDSSLITGTITNAAGRFNISEIPTGKYYVKIEFIGYKPLIQSDLQFSVQNPMLNLKKVFLEPQSQMLDAVNVVDERPLYQNKIDKKIINPENDALSAGASALETLENAPSVEVDVEGNVSLRGSTGCTILIDGRPSGYSGESAGELLSQIPTSAIDNIEVITNPSSKYDPEGVTGIINIILKKSNTESFNGSLNAGIGSNLSYNFSGNISYRTKKVNLYANFGLNRRLHESENWVDKETYYGGDTMLYHQESMSNRGGLNYMARLGADFYVTPTNTFSLVGDIRGGNNNNEGNTLYENYVRDYLYEHDVLTRKYKAFTDNESKRFVYNVRANWEKVFSSKDHTLNFEASYRHNNNDNNSLYQTNEYDIPIELWDSLWYSKLNVTDGLNQNIEGKIDYTMPIGEKMHFDAGGSTQFRLYSNDLKIGELYGTQSFIANNDYDFNNTKANLFDYNENVNALYAQFGHKINKFSYQLGMRGEYVLITGITSQQDSSIDLQNDYLSLYPTAYVMYELNKTNEFKLNYTRRVNRPGRWNLNPFMDVSDTMNIRTGNPKLQPEYVNSIDFSYFHYLKGNGSLSASVYYRNITNIMTRVSETRPVGVTISTWDNLKDGYSHSLGIDVNINTKLWKWWSINITGNFAFDALSGSSDFTSSSLNNSGFSGGLKFGNTFNLTENFVLQFNGRFNSGRVMAQGRSYPSFMADMGLKHDFLKKKLSVTLRVSDVFNTMKFSSETSDKNFFQRNENDPNFMIGNLSISWRFGKFKMDGKNKKMNGESTEDSYENSDGYDNF